MLSGHRPARGARAPRDCGPRGSARRGPEPPGPLRGRRRQPDGLRRTGRSLEGATLRARAIRSTGEWANRRRGRLRDQRRDPRRDRAIRARSARSPDLFCFGLLAQFDGLLPRLLGGDRREPELPHVGDPQGAHRQPGRARSRCARPTRASRRTSTSATSTKATTRRARTSTRSSPASSSSGASTPTLQRRGARSPRRKCPASTCQTDDELRDFVRDNAWGHHASCTCPIGPREQGGVLSSRLPRARHAGPARGRRLGVPAGSPGSFVSAIYMIGEKAADVILGAADRLTVPRRA